MNVDPKVLKQQVKNLMKKGLGLKKIFENVSLTNDISSNISYSNIKQIKYRLSKEKHFEKKFDGRKLKKITSAILLAIRYLTLRKKGFITGKQLCVKINRMFNIKLKPRTILKKRRSMGFGCYKPKERPILSQKEIELRLNFAEKNLKIDHDRFIFVDETSIWTYSNRAKHCREKNTFPQAVAFSKKQKQKVHVWLGLSSKGLTDLVVFNNNLNSYGYESILKGYLIPFINNRYKNGDAILIQDNDSKHTSKLCTDVLKTNNVKWVKMPANSPDINVIELFWASLKRFISSRSTQTITEVVDSIRVFYNKVKIHHCENYVSHFRTVLEEIVRRDGEWTDL